MWRASYCQIAPHAKICDFKVLNHEGQGNFSNIIEAMYTIRSIKLEARDVVIHGATLSLGGPVAVGSCGVGYSPQCRDCNRLMNSCVVVCIAAGSDGWKTLGEVTPLNQVRRSPSSPGMSISDRGNAEEVITVGSLHSTKPHTYGISFFSSKGSTGDGRFKPHLVAPGEHIMSASLDAQDRYREDGGASRGAPERSGLIAQFLSFSKEFRQQPQAVKRILMDSCTDLGRERNFQGAGMTGAFRMIQSV
jgi:hypothetical protein